jgi:tetratricopeptide (TPR) repeat protein
MSYHPKWKSVNGEPVFLTEPAFMLVIPEQSRVELRYEAAMADRVGVALTLTGLVALVWLLVFPKMSPRPVTAPGPALMPAIAVLVFALSTSLWSWWNNPERVYKQGHSLLKTDHYVPASRAFDHAYSGRHVPAQKAEALFWAGRSLEYADDYAGALERYRELARLYPDNYWAAESLYRIVMLERKARNKRGAEQAYNQLLQDFPGNIWTRKLIEASGVGQ